MSRLLNRLRALAVALGFSAKPAPVISASAVGTGAGASPRPTAPQPREADGDQTCRPEDACTSWTPPSCTCGREAPADTTSRESYPDRTKMLATATTQTNCLLFRLPVELRQYIYSLMWRRGGQVYALHVESRIPDGFLYRYQFHSYPCVLPEDHVFDEERLNEELDRLWGRYQRDGRLEADSRGRPGLPIEWRDLQVQRSTWGDSGGRFHCLCESRPLSTPKGSKYYEPGWAPFLPVLLSCKKIYLEAVDTILQTLPIRFRLGRVTPMHDFLVRCPPGALAHLREIHLSSTDGFEDERRRGSREYRPALGAHHHHDCTWRAVARLPRLRRVVVAVPPAELGDWLWEPCCVFPLDAPAMMTVVLPREDWEGKCGGCGKAKELDDVPCRRRLTGWRGVSADATEVERFKLQTRGGWAPCSKGHDVAPFCEVVDYGLLKFYSDEDSWPPEPRSLIKRDPDAMCSFCATASRYEGLLA